MRILFTGGGTGGHFYPIIAVAEEIRKVADEEKLVQPELFFMSTDSYNERVLKDHRINFIPVRAGKTRRYFSWLNFLDPFKTAYGLIEALFKVYSLYPDIIFSKGGYASIPAVFAGRLLRIPVFIHESDSHPGRANLWASRFAVRIALSYPEAAQYFPSGRTAVVGNPLRQEILNPMKHGAFELLKLDKNIPTIFVIGGSQGSVKINNIILDLLPELIKKYQIIHQVGKNNYQDALERSSVLIGQSDLKERYQLFDYLNEASLRMVAGVAQLVVTRAGSTIFEIAAWGVPSIIIPIPEEISHDQRTNAFTYARSGGAIVIEEKNLTPSILLSEINRVLSDPELEEEMRKGAKNFARPDAGRLIAEEIIKLALEHEE